MNRGDARGPGCGGLSGRQGFHGAGRLQLRLDPGARGRREQKRAFKVLGMIDNKPKKILFCDLKFFRALIVIFCKHIGLGLQF